MENRQLAKYQNRQLAKYVDSGAQRDTRCLDILLVEDSPADAKLLEMILREMQPNCELHTASDGTEALEFLHRRGPFAGAPIPQLIVLDWHLPREDGDNTLAHIKADPQLQRIPVVILSASEADDEVLRGYDLHASCWVVKGPDLVEGSRRLRAMFEFWSNIAQLPTADKDSHLPA